MERIEAAMAVCDVLARGAEQATNQSAHGGKSAGADRFEVIHLVKHQRQQAAETDKSAKRNGIQETQPIGRPASNQHRRAVPPMAYNWSLSLRLFRDEETKEQ